MGKSTDINSEIFEDLLKVFSANRDEAGHKYEHIRAGLIRFFSFRGCADAEALTDETINRVASKIEAFDPVRTPRLSAYFYGFASNVLLEYRRATSREVQIPDDESVVAELLLTADREDDRSICLQSCLQKLEPTDRDMIVEYYGSEGSAKSSTRRSMCEKFGYSSGALHTRIFRIKAGIRDCVENCLGNRKI